MIPRLVATDEEKLRRTLDPARQRLALQLFQKMGVLALDGVVDPSDRAAWRAALGDAFEPRALDMSGALAGCALWANPILLPLLRRLLGSDCVLGALGLISAQPRRPPRPLYPGIDDATLPCYAVRLVVPLDGDALFLADHRAAWSAPPPFAIQLVYCRPWFVDVETTEPALVMAAAEYEQAPDEHRELLARIGSARAQRG